MPYLTPTQVLCPICRQPFVAQLEQIVDAGSDPAGRERLLSGRLNSVTCTHCGKTTVLSTPLLYHDPEHELLLVHLPMELNLPQTQREALIGSLTRSLMSRLPAEERRGYLFDPQTVLTRESLIDRVLIAEGVSAEVLKAQRERGQLLSRLLAAADPELKPLVEAHDSEIDDLFFQMLAATIVSARRAGREAEANRLTEFRNRLLPLASWSRQQGITPKMLEEQQARLDLMERFLAADEQEWPALADEHKEQLDYLFFQLLTAVAEGAEDDQATRSRSLRDRLVQLTSVGREIKVGQEAVEGLRAAAETAGGLSREVLLEQIIDADGDAAVEALALAGSLVLDYSLFILMADRIDAAEKQGNRQEAAKLSSLREKLVTLTESWEKARRARVEQVHQQIDELLKAEEQREAIKRLLPQIDELFLSIIGGRIEGARRAGHEEADGGLEQLLEGILAEFRASAPPEIRLINDLLLLEDEAAIERALDSRRAELTPRAVTLMEKTLEDLRSQGQDAPADRMETVVRLAKSRMGHDAGEEAAE